MAKLIGTAGHVDHGKTTLIRALTGIDADRLPEEKARGMTIDVGFAFIDLPPLGRVSIVDVPGHERFVHNMLVGALGIDVALLCVAADDAVMPQTREHFAILDLLPVERLVVAMTRIDLADPETRELARADVEDLLAKSRFHAAPVVETSATTGEGLAALREALARELAAGESKRIDGPWTMAIDRAFTVRGHGVVATGTLAGGTVRTGDRGILQPGGREVRVRSIQIHGEPAESSEVGTRTALNLVGVKLEEIERGMAVGAPGALFETLALDGEIRWLTPPKHGARVRLSIGADEIIAKAFLSDENPDLVQLRLERVAAVAKGQPFILRRYSPPDVLGGGRVTVPQAQRRRKSEKVATISAAERPQAILEILGDAVNGLSTEEICRRLGETPQTLGDTFESLKGNGKVLGFAGLWFSAAGYEEAKGRFLDALRDVHEKFPTQALVPRERAVSRAGLGWEGKSLDRIVADLASQGLLVAGGTNIRRADFRPQLPPRQRQFLDRVLEEIRGEEINVPSPHDIAKRLGIPHQAVEEIVNLGVQAGELVFLAENVYYTPAQLETLARKVRAASGGKPFAAGTMREALGTSRKYMIPLLEHFDAIRVTVRVGENRVVR
jgi:selenocysteine-specific elongation factor